MARDLTSGNVVQLGSRLIRPVLFLRLGLLSSTQYLWSGSGDLSWNNITWKGTGTLGEISNLTESAETQANGAAVSLNGIANDLLSDSLTEIRVGRPVSIWLGFLDAAGNVVPDPALLRRARVDKPTTTVGVTKSTIQLAIESRLNDWQRARISRLTSEDQKRKWPNDTGLDYSAQLVDAGWKWG